MFSLSPFIYNNTTFINSGKRPSEWMSSFSFPCQENVSTVITITCNYPKTGVGTQWPHLHWQAIWDIWVDNLVEVNRLYTPHIHKNKWIRMAFQNSSPTASASKTGSVELLSWRPVAGACVLFLLQDMHQVEAEKSTGGQMWLPQFHSVCTAPLPTASLFLFLCFIGNNFSYNIS